MLTRVLEPEVMDSDADAREYDAMDHSAVNTQYVDDLLAVLDTGAEVHILDMGTGTAQIPIELCRRVQNARITAVDAAESMLALARSNVVAAGLAERIQLLRADAKLLKDTRNTTDTENTLQRAFDVVISNSVVHHIAEPRTVIAAAVRFTAPGGLLFHRDLARPNDEAQLEQLVAYAGSSTPYQRKLFADSLRAALTVDEVRELIADFGFRPKSVRMTSDRHWTWLARQPRQSRRV